jgi:hypothetical protein
MLEMFVRKILKVHHYGFNAGLTDLLQSMIGSSVFVTTTGNCVQSFASFEVIRAASIKAAVICDVMPYGLVDDVQYLRGTGILRVCEDRGSSPCETLVTHQRM